jgi:hypothetical protein
MSADSSTPKGRVVVDGAFIASEANELHVYVDVITVTGSTIIGVDGGLDLYGEWLTGGPVFFHLVEGSGG